MPHKYTTENIEWLSVNRPLYAERELSARFYDKFKALVSPSALAQQCCKRGFKPPPVNVGFFAKGSVPFNKGLKGIRYSIPTEFVKGSMPHNYKPVGTERFSKDYWYIKVADSKKWRAKHNIIWEQQNGPIPSNHVVIFLDSNIDNFAIDNLALITRSDLLRMNKNGYKQSHSEIKPAVLALSKLEAKLFDRSKAA